MSLYPSTRNGLSLQDCFMQAVSYANRHGMKLDGIELDVKSGIYKFILV